MLIRNCRETLAGRLCGDCSRFWVIKEEIELLKANQIAALEWIDGKLGQLFEKLPSTYPTLTIVCADHGEEFGDNGRFGHAHVDESVMTVPIWVGYTE